jgi:hypothetical protein
MMVRKCTHGRWRTLALHGAMFLLANFLGFRRRGQLRSASVSQTYRSRAILASLAAGKDRSNGLSAPLIKTVALLRLVFQPGNEALAAPKLNGAAICKRFGFVDCIVVVIAC